jgi:hypothetical protein
MDRNKTPTTGSNDEHPSFARCMNVSDLSITRAKRFLLVDFSNCPANEVEKIARAVPDYVTVNPRGSVLVLTDVTGAAFDRDAIRAVKEAAVFDKPFVKKSALIGTEDLPASFVDELEGVLPPGTADFQNPRRSVGVAPRPKRALSRTCQLTAVAHRKHQAKEEKSRA